MESEVDKTLLKQSMCQYFILFENDLDIQRLSFNLAQWDFQISNYQKDWKLFIYRYNIKHNYFWNAHL